MVPIRVTEKLRRQLLDLTLSLMILLRRAHYVAIVVCIYSVVYRMSGVTGRLRELGGPWAIVIVELAGRFAAGRLLDHDGAGPLQARSTTLGELIHVQILIRERRHCYLADFTVLHVGPSSRIL